MPRANRPARSRSAVRRLPTSVTVGRHRFLVHFVHRLGWDGDGDANMVVLADAPGKKLHVSLADLPPSGPAADRVLYERIGRGVAACWSCIDGREMGVVDSTVPA